MNKECHDRLKEIGRKTSSYRDWEIELVIEAPDDVRVGLFNE